MLSSIKSILAAISVLLVSAQFALAQDISKLGGELSTSIPGRNAIQVKAPNVTDPERSQKQLDGFIPFHSKISKEEGLGPNFINNSCGGCHINNGKGQVRIRRTGKRQNQMVIKVSLVGLNEDGSPKNVPGVGEQLADKTTRKRKRRHNIRLRWRKVKGRYPNGKRYTLRKPRLTYRVKGFKRGELVHSLRMTPGIIGAGLLEAIPESKILELSDPEDSNGDGISGIPTYVPDIRANGMSLGRFGYRGSHPTVEQQSAGAAFNDMGVTNPLMNDSEEEPEFSVEVFEELVLYQVLAGVPMARFQDYPEVIRGKELFQQIGCNDCHVMTFETEHAKYPELDGQTIHPFTDLLLHDMGPGLADKRAEFAASGREWRTTPLWGLGFIATVSPRLKQHYLHDGRARSVEEAILWHGGESEASRDEFKALPKADRDALIAFLRSL